MQTTATQFDPIKISSFKAYDIRGELGENLDESIAYRIGRAFAQFLNATNLVIGCDIRASSDSLKKATIEGILDAGTDVIDLGMTGTEEVYFATSHLNADGGIEVTASHNPINFNGLKMVRENSKPISADTGLADIQKIAESGEFTTPNKRGKYTLQDNKTAYIDHLLTYIDIKNLTPLTVVINCGNGSAAPVVDLIEQRFIQANAPIKFIKLHHNN